MKVAFESGFMHYDAPPPDRIDDLAGLRRADRFRFANELGAHIEVEDGRIVGAGYSGGGHMGATTFKLGGLAVKVPGFEYPDLQAEPDVKADCVRFVQTTGGPPPAMKLHVMRAASPSVWTTLALTIYADGHYEHELVGASPFPRHWIYDNDGQLCEKAGLTGFNDWFASVGSRRTPWGGRDTAAQVAKAESATERLLSTQIMGAHCKPAIRKLRAGDHLIKQDEPGTTIYLILDGLLDVEVDGQVVGRIGPGAIVGERAHLEAGLRTATVTATTRCKVALADPSLYETELLADIAGVHHHEAGSAAES
jgi:hypothetical protein